MGVATYGTRCEYIPASSAARAPCGRMLSQMNVTKSQRRDVIVLIKPMMVYIMPYQVSKCDALEIPPLKAIGSNFFRSIAVS